MLGIEELKEKIEITDYTVECPVKGCSEKVERQRKVFKQEEKYKCPKHDIYISPSTFEYQSELDNVLWKDRDDLDLFESLKKVKRESRIARDNSEDAVTWNVFRCIERNNLTTVFLQDIFGIKESKSEIIYWSYSQSSNGIWVPLEEARKEFELRPKRGSEPDLIIVGKKSLIIIEAKFGAGNNTTPSKLYVKDKYVGGGNNWWSKVFNSDFKTIAVQNQKYELARFWLIGSWIANQHNLDFYLINLTLSNQEKDIEHIFKQHIKENDTRKFKRITWKQIYEFIAQNNFNAHDKGIIIRYFRNKSMGYNNEHLKRAFSV
jgi:hypothetical protein